jgi:hypothetical protein
MRSILAIGALICASYPAVTHADSESRTVQILLQKLEERDAAIRDLQKRVEQLERARGQESPAQQAKTIPANKKSAPEDAGKKAPSIFEVDEMAAERALERTLTQAGALLLSVGLAEFQFNFTYSRSEQTTPTFIFQSGQTGLGNIDLRRNEYTAGLSTRFGLPFDSQLEFNLPYRIIDQSLIEPVSFTASGETKNKASAIGDITVGLAKTLHREQGWLPDIIGRASWTAGTGKYVSANTFIGDGFNKIRGALTLLKRQDPLVFTGNFFYESAFENDHITPGDQYGFSIAALLASSPGTSLNIGLDQVFSKRMRINGTGIPGSDQVSSMLVLGTASTISKRAILSLSGGIGLTEGTPNYFINLAVPIRFEIFK